MKTNSFLAPDAIAALVLSSIAQAAVTDFTINQTYSQGNGQSDVAAATINIGGAGSFILDPGSSAQYFDFKFNTGGTFSTYGVALDGYHFLESFSSNATVDLSTVGTNLSVNGDWDTIIVSGIADGIWNSSHSGNLGFRSDGGDYGYIAYDYTRTSGVSTLYLREGAYGSNAGQGITIEAAPEPSLFSLLGLGTLGLAARRRRNS